MGSDQGMVTAEMAVAMPALVAVAAMLAWVLALGGLQATVAHAAREGARAAARGESAGQVRAAVTDVVPGATVSVHRSGSAVVVSAVVRRDPPLRLLRPLVREIRSTATSWWEG